MEMTGSFELDKPVILAAVVACGFSRQFGLNIYDSGACACGVGCARPLPACRTPWLAERLLFPKKILGLKLRHVSFSPHVSFFCFPSVEVGWWV